MDERSPTPRFSSPDPTGRRTRCGSTAAADGNPPGYFRQRSTTISEQPPVALLSQVLQEAPQTETSARAQRVSLSQAPILGEHVLKEDDEDEGAMSLQDLQRKLEGVGDQLQQKLHMGSSNRTAMCMGFEEVAIEGDFRAVTWANNRKGIYWLAFGILLFSLGSIFWFNVRLLNADSTSVTPEAALLAALASNASVNVTTALQRKAELFANFSSGVGFVSSISQRSRLLYALVLRICAAVVLLIVFLVVRYSGSIDGFCLRRYGIVGGGRKLALGVFVFVSYAFAFTSDIALHLENMYTDLTDGFYPSARQNLLPLIMLMIVYTAGIPGVPFSTAAFTGWGIVVIAFVTHIFVWGMDFNAAHWATLWAQLARLLMFNIFGTFVGIEQIRQMRLDFWHVKLRDEAVHWHKLIRRHIHRTLENTLPAPVVRALATGQTQYVEVFPHATVLQADMVGFTPLSAKFSPERVLGILSDIFEEFDTLCELNRVDKVKTIGDAYIVCAGAMEKPQHDDAQRVVRMGVAMQDVVKRIAEKEGVEVAVRIGVHTGRCTGGIIGTVRYHFDMWGGAVLGAVKMEEAGEKFKVHISDTVLPLIETRFKTEPHLAYADVGEVERELGITSTHFIVAEVAPMPLVLHADASTDEMLPIPGHGHGAHQAHHSSPRAASGRSGRETSRRSRESRQHHGKSPAMSIARVSHVATRGRAWASRRGLIANYAAQARRHDADDLDAAGDVEITSRERATSNFFVAPAERNTPTPARECTACHGTRHSNATTRTRGRNSTHGIPESQLPKRNTGGGKSKEGHKEAAAGSALDAGKAAATSSTKRRSSLPASLRAAVGKGAVDGELDGDMVRLEAGEHPGPPPGPPPKTSSMEAIADPSTPLPPSLAKHGDGSSAHHQASDAQTAGRPGQNPANRKDLEGKKIDAERVRADFAESVRSSLRRSAIATSTVLAFFGLYDWLQWRGHYVVVGYPDSMTRMLAVRYFAAFLSALLPTIAIVQLRHLKGQLLPFINALLIVGPFISSTMIIFIMPDRSLQYMLCIAVFQAWFGYTMLALPTSMLACLQLILTISFYVAERIMVSIDDKTNESLRPGWLNLDTPPDLQLSTTVIYMASAHFFGLLHHRRRRRDLRSNARMLVKMDQTIEDINLEVECCEQLLANVFPPSVLERLQNRTGGEGHSSFAEKFHNCTFLFAKIVGLKQLTDLGEAGSRDPADVVTVLQLIFDRFDTLADTFKVQKVRKTVNEYYMVAAGLPDPSVLPEPKERALATTALAFSMVHVMDIINADATMRELGVTLHAQVGIHTGDAIAGIIGHKRYQYDLCGDAVNTAARMCSYSEPGCINVSNTTLSLIRGEYGSLYRGERAVKGKGNMSLYFLTGRLNPSIQELIDSGPPPPLLSPGASPASVAGSAVCAATAAVAAAVGSACGALAGAGRFEACQSSAGSSGPPPPPGGLGGPPPPPPLPAGGGGGTPTGLGRVCNTCSIIMESEESRSGESCREAIEAAAAQSSRESVQSVGGSASRSGSVASRSGSMIAQQWASNPASSSTCTVDSEVGVATHDVALRLSNVSEADERSRKTSTSSITLQDLAGCTDPTERSLNRQRNTSCTVSGLRSSAPGGESEYGLSERESTASRASLKGIKTLGRKASNSLAKFSPSSIASSIPTPRRASSKSAAFEGVPPSPADATPSRIPKPCARSMGQHTSSGALQSEEI